MPGMTAVGRADFGGAKVSGRIWNPTDDFAVPNNAQPIYKLHGSINWKGTGPDTDMVIMGGGKPEAIQAIPVLRHYHEIFGQEVRRGGTRVTIIGYGFGDKHINDILEDGVRNHGTRMFVIDPRGSRLAYEMRPYQPGQIGEPAVSPFEEWFHIGLHSASSRPFRQLLWNDSLEGEELVRFIGGN